MLGRLHMSVAECIEVYKNISEEVFTANWRNTPSTKLVTAGAGHAWYKAEDLERKVKELLVERGLDKDVPLREQNATCKV